MSRIIAVDPSPTNTGIVVLEGAKPIASSVVGYPLKADATEHERVKRFITIATAVREMLVNHNVETLVMEGPSYGSVNRLFDVGGLAYMLWNESREIGISVIPPLSARKRVFGKATPPEGVGVKAWINQQLRSSLGDPKSLRDTDPDLADVLTNEHLRDALVVGYAHLGVVVCDAPAKSVARKSKTRP